MNRHLGQINLLRILSAFICVHRRLKIPIMLNLLITIKPRVRASQSGLTQRFENKHHVLLTHRCPVPFLSQATG